MVMGFLICVTISFYSGWKLSLVVVSYIPIVVITNAIIGKVSSHYSWNHFFLLILFFPNGKHCTYFQFQASLTVKELSSYSDAANVAEEVLSGIRTVFAFGGENVEIERYNRRLINAKHAVRIKGMLTAVCDAFMRFSFFAAYALGYWYGVKLVLEDRHKVEKEYTPAVLMIVRTIL